MTDPPVSQPLASPAPRLETWSAPDGSPLAVRVWPAPQPPVRVVMLHGIVSHGGWYVSSGRYLASRGYEVHLLDRRGSGVNWRGRGDVRDYRDWLVDVEAYLEQLPRDAPRALLGISWGGKLAAAVAADRPDLLEGIGMICPGLFAYQQAGLLQRGALQALRLIGMGSRTVSIPLRDPALFTEVPAAQGYIRRDPFTLRRITVRFAREDLRLNRLARQGQWAAAKPALLMLAGRDRIVHNARTEAFFEALPGSDKSLVHYSNAAHTLEFEEDRGRYWDDLAAWLATGLRPNP